MLDKVKTNIEANNSKCSFLWKTRIATETNYK